LQLREVRTVPLQYGSAPATSTFLGLGMGHLAL
jgi:hypothetical protein